MNAQDAKNNVEKYETYMHSKHLEEETKLKAQAVKNFSSMLKKVLKKIDRASRRGLKYTSFGREDLFFCSKWSNHMRSLIEQELTKLNFICKTTYYNGLFTLHTTRLYIYWD